MAFWDRFFAKRTLSGVRAPTKVSVRARIASTNSFTSALSGSRGAVIVWRFFARYSAQRSSTESADRELYAPLGVCLFGDELRLATSDGTVLVPAGQFAIEPGGIL